MYLATICNSTIIEMCDDMIRISHGFRWCNTGDQQLSVIEAHL